MESQRTGIYKITNKLNGKIYVGQSVHLLRRWTEHKRKYKNLKSRKQLYQAMREDGIENFIFEIIEECPKELLNERELYWIKRLNTLENGYNMSTIENMQHKVPVAVVKQIQQDLINSNLTNAELARKYNVSHTWISLVNQGKMWYNKDLTYPLRPILFNTKKEHHCCDCGALISRRAKRCQTCAQKIKINIRLSKTNKTSREELKEMIRKMPFTQIGKIFDVSDNTIRKWCKKFDLPSTKRDINSYSDEEWDKI